VLVSRKCKILIINAANIWCSDEGLTTILYRKNVDQLYLDRLELESLDVD
jgi:hypothetical protein